MACIIKRSRSLLFSRVDDDYLAIDGEGGYCYSLNEPAWRVWMRLGEQPTLETLCAGLMTEFMVEPAKCQEEIRSLLEVLQAAGLVAFDDN